MNRRLLAFGAAHTDRIATLAGPPGPWSVPGRVAVRAGGATFNVARHVASLGHDAILRTPSDPAAVKRERGRVVLLPWSNDVRGEASYTAILDPSGDLHVAVSDMDVYDAARPADLPLEALRGATHVFADANLPPDVLEAIADALPPTARLYAATVSPAKAHRWQTGARRVDVLFASLAEARALAGFEGKAPDVALALARLVRRVVVSNGPRPLHYADGEHVEALPVQALKPVDVTGAGDALAGGFIAAEMHGRSVAHALRVGMERARATIGGVGPYPFQTDPSAGPSGSPSAGAFAGPSTGEADAVRREP